ncbi:uncharacterized protein LOC128555524 [Mercenaria mercenaria]|uniref:uncharacterized protein LOC128555524 n=1 Tax=Mercenaria mercenaria TaxID=6596 RepID=UPI00234F7421|nr:uncharacterized protein LOC128555524 [Mercenaria mercenaria]
MSAFNNQNVSSSFNFQDFSSRLSEPDAIIVEIASEVTPSQVVKPDIEDDQKRWLIVGICLHSVISPALRQYIPPFVSKLYSALKRIDQIDKQTFAKYLIRYKPTNKELNYEAINNNSAIPKVKGKKDVQKYNYNVTSDVDLTKLFMITSMAHYTGFDDTCDSSALLGIIINIDKFPALPKQTAEKVRADIRNPWAHCNFSEWDVIKYQNSFQLMHQFIRNLQLPVQDETAVLAKLIHWQTNGVQFLQGTTLGLELVQELKNETRALSKFILDIVPQTDKSFKVVHNAILSMEGTLNDTVDKINLLETDMSGLKDNLNTLTDTVDDLQGAHEQHYKTVEKMKTDIRDVQSNVSKTQLELVDSTQKVDHLESRLDDISVGVSENRTKLNDTKTEIIYVRTDIESAKTEVKNIKTEMDEVKEDMKKTKFELHNTKADVAKNRVDIEELTKYLSSDRPNSKVFFYPLDRVSSFVSREDELETLQKEFQRCSNDHHVQVICGLGGIGKTTLSIEYAWTFQSFYPGGVFWMSAETTEALEDSIQRLAIDTNIVGKNAKETLTKTLKWLSSIQDRWLLVVDNVDMEEIRGSIKELLLGSWKRNSKGHIIITSRREAEEAGDEFNVKLKDCITLDVLTERESVQFMTTRSGCKNDKNDRSLELLIEELGGLPLALEQAAAHIKALRCTFKEYLEKFNRKRLKILKASRSQFVVSKERQAVRTTWQLNFDYIDKQSEEEGLGCAAVTVMEILAFLHADEIPLTVLNVGSPEILDEDLLDAFQEEIGVKQVAEILARFSLFSRCGGSTLSVHRLVQEVIRENLTDSDRKAFILQCATRMINKALERTQSPREALKEENIGRASLQMWSKLALNANTLKTYLFEFTKTNRKQMHICFNIESTKLLQTSAIYHSLFQRQDEALACQAQMLSIIPALGIEESDYRDLTCIKIPLLQNDRQIIQSSMIMAISTGTEPLVGIDQAQTVALLDPEPLRIMGNEAFKSQKYQDAIQCYTEAITASQDNIDPKVLSNRSLAYLRISDYENALHDADLCIQIDPNAHKAYSWKAYAIANLIRLGMLPKSWESAGLAAAAVAGYLNKECLLEYRMKIEYPVVKFHIIEDQSTLGQEMVSMMNSAYTTLLLRKGNYQIDLHKAEIATKSVQIIGIEEGVEIHSPLGVSLIHPSKISSKFRFETEINVFFENVTFPNETGQILVDGLVNATFYRCVFSNGRKGCEDFPFCNGRRGCVNQNPDECRKLNALQEKAPCPHPSGVVGHAGICADGGGNVLIDNCTLNRCGGGGTLSINGSVLKIRHSIVRNMRQMGVEAREGGSTVAEDSTICDNQFHGVAIGPKGRGVVKSCVIQNNKNEGIWCGGNLDTIGESRLTQTSNSEGGSTCMIFDNLIYQNGMSGISLDGGSYDVSGNKIFENWLWGMMVKSRSTTNICNNDIFENKCGGIRIGVNYSAPVMMDGNTIRDHTGPAVHTERDPRKNELPRSLHGNKGLMEMMKAIGMMDDESTIFSLSPIITTRNVIEKNNRGEQHPRQILSLVETCCFCHINSNKLKCCAKCKKASYCSKECQKQHWKRHQIICKLMMENFTVDIKMSETTKWDKYFESPPGFVSIRGTNAPLPGLGEGTPPEMSSDRRFIVKIQSGSEYTRYDPNKMLRLYDQTQTLDIYFRNPNIYHLLCECGVLAASKFTTKKMFCWASFKNNGKTLRMYIDTLPTFQTW